MTTRRTRLSAEELITLIPQLEDALKIILGVTVVRLEIGIDDETPCDAGDQSA